MTKRPTIIDVAKAAGVTDGTVSRALASDPRVRESTRRKVVEAAQKLGYRPHLHARALKRGSSGIIGVFAEGGSWILYDAYFGRLLAGLALAADKDDARLLFYLPDIVGGSDSDLMHADLRFKGVEELGDGRLDGAVVLGGPVGQERELEDLHRSGLPLVLLSRNVAVPGFSQLLSGSRERSALAAEMLIRQGHERLGFIGLNSSNYFNQTSLEGMRQSLNGRGSVVQGAVEQSDPYDLAELTRVVDELLAAGATGWVLGISEQAMVVLDILKARGVEVPGQVSLVSFGPLPNTGRARTPRLSLVDADLEAEGRACYAMIKARLAGAAPETRVIAWRRGEGGGTVGPPPRG
jgi:DNA-binding LacI/PurR family transcriptional regulator